MNIKDKPSQNPLAITNAFNSYFSSVAEDLLNKNFTGANSTNNNNDPLAFIHRNFSQLQSSVYLKKTTTHEINKIIHSLKSKDFYGYDEISTRILKIIAPYILSPLTYIFNKILSTGVFPDRLKFSEVRPLFKKGDKTEFCNYRPISLLPSFSKIIEKIICRRLYNYLNNNNILVDQQHGFRKKLSTKTAIFTLINNVLLSFKRRNFTGGIFCDLQKAFDCINHAILLHKIKLYGISGTANKLMESYLENRYQRVSVYNNKPLKLSSNWVHVKHGVPQGSILGPLLFPIYINNLSLSINKLANPILFADDTTIIISNANTRNFKTILIQ